jgi:hypothetical protein
MVGNRSLLRRPLLALVPLLALTALAASAAPRVVSIGVARTLPLGTLVTVGGIATTPSGAFDSSFFDKGFAIQDKTGGIFISLADDLRVKPRRKVVVTGKLEEHSGLLTIKPASNALVVLDGVGPEVGAKWAETVSISDDTEGLLVFVVGRITEGPTDDLPFGFKMKIDDGSGPTTIFVNTQTGIDTSTLHEGDLIKVIGFSSQFEDHWEIDPRRPSDIIKPEL